MASYEKELLKRDGVASVAVAGISGATAPCARPRIRLALPFKIISIGGDSTVFPDVLDRFWLEMAKLRGPFRQVDDSFQEVFA